MLKNNPTFHTAVYGTGHFLATIAGLITFPIITRLFSVEDYGILNLISLTVLIMVSLGKAGLQRSIIRFSSEARGTGASFKTADVYLTALIGMGSIVLVVQALWMIGLAVLPAELIGDDRVRLVFLISGMMVVGQVLYSGLTNILVSEQRSVTLAILDVVKRYSLILVLIPGLFLAENKLQIFYLIGGLHELAFCVLLLFLCQRAFAILKGRFSLSLFHQFLWFSVPLMGYELLTYIFNYFDRIQIGYFLGAHEIGLYAAGYNLCIYIQTILVASMVTAITPMYMDRWESEGRAGTEVFLSTVLRYYLLAAIPTAVGTALIGEELIMLLAGEKYAGAHGIIPFVIVGMLIEGVNVVTTAGLQIQKRTGVMTAAMGLATATNLLLNLALIPLMGIAGAALSTLLAYILFTAFSWYLGRHVLTIRLQTRPILLYGLAAGIMAVVVLSIELSGALGLFVKAGAGALTFGIMVLILDGELRRLLITQMLSLRRRLVH